MAGRRRRLKAGDRARSIGSRARGAFRAGFSGFMRVHSLAGAGEAASSGARAKAPSKIFDTHGRPYVTLFRPANSTQTATRAGTLKRNFGAGKRIDRNPASGAASSGGTRFRA